MSRGAYWGMLQKEGDRGAGEQDNGGSGSSSRHMMALK